MGVPVALVMVLTSFSPLSNILVVDMGVVDYCRMMRLPNSLMSGFGAVFMLLMFRYYDFSGVGFVRLLAGFVTGFTITSASMLVNDVVDLEVDRVNKPWKPLPSGKASPRISLNLALVLVVVGVLLNLVINIYVALVAAVYAVLGLGYSFLRRHWWSQLVVAASTTGPIIYGYIAAEAPPSDTVVVAGLSLTIFIVTLGREVLKAIQDIEGDRIQGYETIPLKTGVEASSKLLVVTGITGPLTGVLTGLLTGSSILYKILITVAGVLYFYSMTKAYRFLGIKEKLEEARRETLVEMLIGLLGFWLYKA